MSADPKIIVKRGNECVNIPPDLKAAIRAFMEAEWKRLRRNELSYLRRGMMSELKEIDEALKSE